MQKKIPPMIDDDQTVFMLTLQKRHTVFGASTTAIFILGGETEVKYHSNPLWPPTNKHTLGSTLSPL